MSNSSSREHLVRIRDLVKEFTSGHKQIRVLDGVQLDIHPDDYISIQGPSGAGKTTLLHLMGLLDVPTSGTISVDGIDVTELSETERSRLRNRKFGFVYQFYHLIGELSALENVLLPAMIHENPFSWYGSKASHRERARHLLDQVGLSEREEHLPSQLSGGERQRVAIARALIMRPAVLLCDEPTGNLDQTTSEQIHDLLETLREDHHTALVLATHDDQLSNRAMDQLRIQNGTLTSSNADR